MNSERKGNYEEPGLEKQSPKAGFLGIKRVILPLSQASCLEKRPV